MTALTPLLAPDAACDASPARQRIDARSNMFVTAALYGNFGSAPVRIRNMSRGGALIESAIIPPEGSPVRLSRGSLSVRGRVVWQRDNRAGIRFDTAVEVIDWFPRGNQPTGQQRVDDMLHACRTTSENDGGRPAIPSEANLVETIRQLLDYRDALNSVAGELTGSVALATAHPTALQKIDVTAQLLEKLASRLAGSN